MDRHILKSSAAVLLIASCTATAPRPFDQPDDAAAYYNAKRGITESTPVADLYANARLRMESMLRYSTVDDRIVPRGRLAAANDTSATTSGGWTFLGPGNIGGRTRALGFDPSNPNTMYAGGVSGGIWKTTDGGASWHSIADSLMNLAVNSLAIDPRNPQILYAGTGEGYFREDVRGTALPLRGNGIFVTRNGGGSWDQLPSTRGNDFLWVNDLAISTHDSRRIYAATRSGVWRSTDGGAAWSRVLPTTVKGGCLDLALRPGTDGDYLFAACGIFEQATVYRAKRAERDEAWMPVLSEPGMSRTSLAIAPSNPSIVYALAASNLPGGADTTQNLHAVYRSDSDGDPGTWSARTSASDPVRLHTVLLSNPYAALVPQCAGSQGSGSWIPMGWHCNVIAVDPVDPERVWAGGVDLFRSDDGGRSWGIASYWWTAEDQPSYVHADQHVIAFHPAYDGASNQTVFVANDGGVHRTDNALAATGRGDLAPCRPSASDVKWTSLVNNYGVTQFYHGAVFPDGRRFLGGAQDNGTVIGDIGSGTQQWQRILGGDGGYVAVDPVDPSVVYAESQNGNIAKSVDGGKSFMGIGRRNDTYLFITPFLIDPNAHTRVWIGGRRLWRIEGTGTWIQASASLPGLVSAIAVAPGRSDRVLAGTNGGAITRSDAAMTATATTEWSAVTPRSGFVSSLAFDPNDINVAYATYAGFGGTHVWKSSDAGATWTPLDGTGDGALPDIPVHAIAIDPTRPSRMYLGTDLGVFVSIDGGARWMVERGGLPAAVTEWITIAQGGRGPAIYAFTHGRGAWRAELTPPTLRRRALR